MESSPEATAGQSPLFQEGGWGSSQALRDMGFTIVRFRNEEVLEEWHKVAERLRDALG